MFKPVTKREAMKIKVLKSESDYNNAISELEKIGDNPKFESNSKLIEQFDLISALIELYEKKYFPIEKGDPIEIIKLKMKYMELQRKDLIPYMGSKGMVSDVLNKKRGLSKNMIRGLSKFLKIDQEILNVEYSLSAVKESLKTKVIIKNLDKNPFELSPHKLKCVHRFKEKTQNQGIFPMLCSNT